MEHPEGLDWIAHDPSCWRLPEVGHLTRVLEAIAVCLDQCTCGAEFKKPTRFWAAGLPPCSGASRSSRARTAATTPKGT